MTSQDEYGICKHGFSSKLAILSESLLFTISFENLIFLFLSIIINKIESHITFVIYSPQIKNLTSGTCPLSEAPDKVFDGNLRIVIGISYDPSSELANRGDSYEGSQGILFCRE